MRHRCQPPQNEKRLPGSPFSGPEDHVLVPRAPPWARRLRGGDRNSADTSQVARIPCGSPDFAPPPAPGPGTNPPGAVSPVWGGLDLRRLRPDTLGELRVQLFGVQGSNVQRCNVQASPQRPVFVYGFAPVTVYLGGASPRPVFVSPFCLLSSVICHPWSVTRHLTSLFLRTFCGASTRPGFFSVFSLLSSVIGDL